MSRDPLTTDQVLAWAPDAASAKAGQALAVAHKWVSTGQNDRAVWGECAGSGALPYQVTFDTTDTTFRCTCPSRKIPCKHVLGLLLLRAFNAAAVQTAEQPEWVASWMAARDARPDQRAQRPAPRTKTADPETAAATRERREERIASGLRALSLWLDDLVRQGLATAQTRPYGYWDTAAARLVDAQAPGAARMVRRMARIPASGPGWPERLLESAARLRLLIEGYERLAVMPSATADDLRTAVGWTVRQEDVLAREPVNDRWAVLGRRVEGDELRVQRTWLAGVATGHVALLLSFAHGAQPFDVNVSPGSWIDGDVVFYPGAVPLRAALREGRVTIASAERQPGESSIAAATEAYAGALTRNPWLELYPLSLRAVVPALTGDTWLIRDVDNRVLRLSDAHDDRNWVLLALSGGHPIDVMGEWDGRFFYPLSAAVGEHFVALDTIATMSGVA